MVDRYLRNRPFMVVKYIFTPGDGERTESKNWGENAKWNSNEHVTVEDRIKPKHEIEAHIIIDLLHKKLIKNRFPESDEEVLKYFYKKYNKEITQSVEIWLRSKGKLGKTEIEQLKDVGIKLSTDKDSKKVKIKGAKEKKSGKKETTKADKS